MNRRAENIPVVSDDGIKRAKYINVMIIVPDDVAPRLRQVCIMFGTGDEAYVEELKEILLRYMNDPSVSRYIEIE
jgi:hypothetical protein